MEKFLNSELILNADGSVYHLHLLPEQIADTIILVGDPGRVSKVSQYFDRIEYKVAYREFVTHTGWFNGKRISCIATGIGPDNIDIVINELDQLANYDLVNRVQKDSHTSLNLLRFGTSGGLRKDVPVGSLIVSAYGVGLDNLMWYYEREQSDDLDALAKKTNDLLALPEIKLYASKASEKLVDALGAIAKKGITLTSPGFYAPQGRKLRYRGRISDPAQIFKSVEHNGYHVTNMEMETSALLGLSEIFGHNAVALNAIVANREIGEFHKNPAEAVDYMIKEGLQVVSQL